MKHVDIKIKKRKGKNNLVSEKKITSFFDKEAKGYEDSRYSFMTNLRSKIIREQLSAGLVLDVGCNCGHLIRDYITNQKVIGIDLSLESMKAAIDINNLDLVQASAINLPFRDELFDFIVCSESLYYFEKPELFIESAMRKLKKGGKLIIISSNQLYYKIGKLVGPFLGLTPKDINEKTFYPTEIIKMLKDNNYINISNQGYAVIPMPWFSFLDRTFLNRFGLIHLISGLKK